MPGSVSLHLKSCFWEDYERISFRLVVFLGGLQLRDIFGCESIERKSVDPDAGVNVFRDFVFVFTWS